MTHRDERQKNAARRREDHRCRTVAPLWFSPGYFRHARQAAGIAAYTVSQQDHRGRWAIESIIDWSIGASSRLGYFAALYKRITIAVRTAVAQGVFQDAPRIERLDVTFASRYFEALNGYFHPGKFPKPTRSWQVTLNAASRAEPIILQHMLAGVNVHIGLDLGIAAQSIGAGGQLPAGTVNLRSCGRSANHIRLIRHTRPGESRRRNGENRPRIAQVDSAPSRHPRGQDRAVPGPGRSLWRLPLYRS